MIRRAVIAIAGLSLVVLAGWWVVGAGGGHGSSTADCPVTIPNGSTRPGDGPSRDHYGNGRLWTALPLDGKLVVTNKRPLPPGTAAGYVHRDGSISIEFPWWGVKSAGNRLLVIGRLSGTSRINAGEVIVPME